MTSIYPVNQEESLREVALAATKNIRPKDGEVDIERLRGLPYHPLQDRVATLLLVVEHRRLSSVNGLTLPWCKIGPWLVVLPELEAEKSGG